MSTALAVIQHQQATRLGSITGTSTPIITLIVAVLPIVTTGVTSLVHMYKRLIALIRSGTSYPFAVAATREQEHLKWTRNLFQSQVTFNDRKEELLWARLSMFSTQGMPETVNTSLWILPGSILTSLLSKETRSRNKRDYLNSHYSVGCKDALQPALFL